MAEWLSLRTCGCKELSEFAVATRGETNRQCARPHLDRATRTPEECADLLRLIVSVDGGARSENECGALAQSIRRAERDGSALDDSGARIVVAAVAA